MEKIGTVNVVGVPYSIYLYVNEFELLNQHAKERDERYNIDSGKANVDGYCDYYSKEIRFFTDKYTSKEYFKLVLMHEITHAFLYEIGNSNYADEDFVDKISKWTPQISDITRHAMELMGNVGHKKR